jgi:hypothetical protein
MGDAAAGEIRHLCEDVGTLRVLIGALLRADASSDRLMLEASVSALRARLDRLCDIAAD